MNSWVDIAVIVAYLVGTTVFGCSFYFRNGSGDANTFMAGGGRIPGWVLALSIFATYVSSISFLALPAKAYLSNWNVLVLSFSIPIAAGIAAVWFVPFYRRMTGVSAYSFLEDRFGFWSRAYASGCFLLMQGVRSGMILFLLALLLKALLGFSIPIVILVVGASTVVYSMLGGLQAVVWTDAVQAILLIGGALICLVVLGCTLPDGLAAGLKTAFDADKFSLGSFSVSEWGSETFWVTFAYGVFLNLQNFKNLQELVVLVVHLGVNRVHSSFIDPYQPAAVLAGFFIVWNFLYNIAVVNISVLNSKFLLADILMVILVNLAR